MEGGVQILSNPVNGSLTIAVICLRVIHMIYLYRLSTQEPDRIPIAPGPVSYVSAAVKTVLKQGV